MSDYAKSLRSAARNWASAYLQFETGRNREGYVAYSFVEDDDDKWFYQLSLTNHNNICYLSCGGKSGVISVFKKLKEEGTADGHLFFVDRDTESMPFEFGDEILRTELYSWESYACQPEYVGWFLQRRSEPNLSESKKKVLVDAWVKSTENFGVILVEHTALCRTALVSNKSLGLSDIKLKGPIDKAGYSIKPSDDHETLLKKPKETAAAYGISEADIERRVRIFSGLDMIKYAQGKFLFDILRIFIDNACSETNINIRGSYNSPIDWIMTMPWDRGELSFIRNYAETRIK